MRLDIRYVTRFDYSEPVRESINELRACPATDHRQQLVTYRVTTSPVARPLSSVDYWDTRVDVFGIREPHDHLEITAESVVETSPAAPFLASPTVAELSDPAFTDEYAEYLLATPHCEPGARVHAAVRERLDQPGADATGLVLALYRFAATSLAYGHGATFIGMGVEEVLDTGTGVCQDYAHLLVSLCRVAGIPARYVSGYLFAADDSTGAETDGDVAYVQTHAWVEVALPGAGWWALDPTNRQEVGERHVKIGHGRDYGDVTPLKGTYVGGATHDLAVEVEMRRSHQLQQQQ